jgi:hypothetical protein
MRPIYLNNTGTMFLKLSISLSHLPESNQRPTDYKSVALPAELKWLEVKEHCPGYFRDCKGKAQKRNYKIFAGNIIRNRSA